MRLVLLKSGRVRRANIRYLEYGEAFAGGGDGGWAIFLRGKGVTHHLGAVGEARKDRALRKKVGADYLQVMRSRGLVEASLLRLVRERSSVRLGSLSFLVANHRGEDRA